MPKSRKNPPRRWTKCHGCGGTGLRDYARTIPCTICGGTGRVKERDAK